MGLSIDFGKTRSFYFYCRGLRGENKDPTTSKPVSNTISQVGVSSMDRHPFQGHIVAIGSHDGMLTVYDMRKAQTPVTVLAGPESCLNQLRFHPDRADHMFTASESGALWHWAPLDAKTSVSSKNSNPFTFSF